MLNRMNESTLRAWWWHRQGLDGSLREKSPAQILEQSGWARSVGGVGPYVSLYARGGTSRADADAAVAALDIHELPSARGCTYVLPASDYELALTVAQPFGDGDMRTAAKLGVTEKEVDKLCSTVVATLGDEPLDPDGIKKLAGKAVRNLGEEGKKKGMITTLPLALGLLQTRGLVRRVPVDGRLDQQRYKYVKWSGSPLAKSTLSRGEAFTELARRFFRWVGPATMKEFQWFSGLGVKAAADAVAPLALVSAVKGGDRLLAADDVDAFNAFHAPKEPQYALVSSLDSISATRRDVSTLLDEGDRAAEAQVSSGERRGASLVDLAAHAIFDRGRLIGYWEYDVDAQRIVWATFEKRKDRTLARAVDETEAFVRDQLGDARSFSLDSPKSRRPKLDNLARAAAALGLALIASACSSSGEVQTARLAPSRTASLVACMLSSPTTSATTSVLLDSCAKEVPKMIATGFDQLQIDGILAGTAGAADPGIRAACATTGGTRAIAGIETMGYGVVMDNESERVLVVQQDDVTTYHRDGKVESARLPASSTTTDAASGAAAPSACAMAILQAITIASICADQQWTGGGCAALKAPMQNCGDPKRQMVDPDLAFVCQPNVDGEAVTTAAAAACARQGRICAPEVSMNGWLRDPGGICASPRASVSADKETCVVPVSVKGPRGTADITAVILWGRATSGGPIFTAEPAQPRG
ncbi:MAG: hypothetical protein JWL61_237 [Gemmatimonadetes bacterium]|nr:hypothetical protein [Gemmatimonadota bacterium]